MALVKITDLPVASSLTGAEYLEVSQGGFSRKSLLSAFALLAVNNIFTEDQTISKNSPVFSMLAVTGDTQINLVPASGSKGRIGTGNATMLELYTSSLARLRIPLSGGVQILTSSNLESLQVNVTDGGFMSISSPGAGTLLMSSSSGSGTQLRIDFTRSGGGQWNLGLGAQDNTDNFVLFNGLVGKALSISSTTNTMTLGNPTSGTSLQLPAAASAFSSLNVPHGAAPSAPNNGDLWTTTAGVFVRINGVTKSVNLT